MPEFKKYTEPLLNIKYRKAGQTTKSSSPPQEDDDMGSKQSKVSPPQSPKTDLTKVQNGRIKKPITRPGKLVGKKPVKPKKPSGSATSSSSKEQDEPMTDNSVSEDEQDVDREGVSDDDFRSHHSSLPNDPPESVDPGSDEESHPSGIGSDRSVHTDPEEEEQYEYAPDGDYEMPGDTKVDFFLDVQHKVRMRDVDRSDWHEAEIKLWDELNLRGTQPLIPLDWAGDFPTCPPSLFSKDYDQTFLNSTSGDEFAGTFSGSRDKAHLTFAGARALRELVALGGRIRSVLTGSSTREKRIKWGIQQYIKWAEKDGGYNDKIYHPIITVTAGKPNQDITVIAETTEANMRHLASLQREALLLEEGDENHPAQFSMEPPLIYGVMIAGTVVAFVTLSSETPTAKVRTIAHFNYDDSMMDVWNAFAIAILVVATRDWMTARKEDLRDSPKKADVDA